RALVLDHLGGHLLGQAHKALLALGAVALGVDADVAALFAAAVHGVVGQVLYGVEGLAAAADDRAHARSGQLDKQSAVVAVAYRYLGLDAHALKQAVQKALRGGLDALGVLGLIFGRSGLGGALRARLGALGAHLGLGRG